VCELELVLADQLREPTGQLRYILVAVVALDSVYEVFSLFHQVDKANVAEEVAFILLAHIGDYLLLEGAIVVIPLASLEE